MGCSFLLVSSRSRRLGFCNHRRSRATSALPSTFARSRLNHMPAPISPATSALPVNLASNFGAPGQPRQQLRRSRSTSPATRRSRSTSPATSALPVNLASNFGAPGQPRQQPRRSRSTSPATSALPVNLASNFGAPGQPRQQLRRSRSTSPATSALPVNLASNFGAPGQPRQQLWRSTANLASNFGAPGQPRVKGVHLLLPPNHGVGDVRSVEMWCGHRVLPLQHVRRQHSVNHSMSCLQPQWIVAQRPLWALAIPEVFKSSDSALIIDHTSIQLPRAVHVTHAIAQNITSRHPEWCKGPLHQHGFQLGGVQV